MWAGAIQPAECHSGRQLLSHTACLTQVWLIPGTAVPLKALSTQEYLCQSLGLQQGNVNSLKLKKNGVTSTHTASRYAPVTGWAPFCRLGCVLGPDFSQVPSNFRASGIRATLSAQAPGCSVPLPGRQLSRWWRITHRQRKAQRASASFAASGHFSPW